MRILVAEDDAISRTLLERTLQRAGYEVISVENGAKAIAELVKQDGPRLALLDWVMPEMDGVEVCREIRRRKEQAYTYLIMPFDVDELKARLRSGHRILELEDHLVEARESMRFQATHDLLTSLWNRGVILELMSHEIMRSRREHSCTALMMCDIDHFKSVNDQYGHAVGDDVLREVARRLHNSVRSYDMVGRYGGEEFLVALNKCNPGSAVSRAENLRMKIGGRPIQTANKPMTVTISIGVALSTEFTECTVEELMHQADMALYAAKAAGRNCVRVAQPSGIGKPAEVQTTETQVLTS